MNVGDLVKTRIQDHDGHTAMPVCTLGVIVDKEEILDNPTNPILTVRLFLEYGKWFTNVYFQSDLEVVSNG